ncbi:MAG: ATP-binding protein [Bacteroidales bacterium]|nr:ATP-binding protein [Bacteroidales bacterium]
MKSNIIAREAECQELKELYNSKKAEFVAVYGRRRVGKTFLIREFFNNKFVFDLAGLANSTKKEQLANFRYSINRSGEYDFPLVKSWLDAFEQLITLLSNAPKGRKVVFIDEIAWLDTKKSRFLSALEHFWNGWACARHDIMLVVCGSSTSWIINRLVNNHGGLYNRLTATMYLKPFTLRQCELFLKRQKIKMNRYEIAECYMVMGGIPYYLSKLKSKFGLSQNIDNLFFKNSASLKNEFENLYASLFDNSENYIKIVEALSKKNKGLTRSDIVKITKLKSGSILTAMLKDLENCDFIRSYSAFGKKKNGLIYQLMDSFTLFYFAYLHRNELNDERFWTNSLNSPQRYSWAGYAFEVLALHHTKEIKNALGISGIQSSVCAWNSERSNPAAQIDLIINRKDEVINLFEIKFSKSKFEIDKKYEENLRNKITCFETETRTTKATHLVMLTTYGLAKNKHAYIAQNSLSLKDLFE